MYTVHTHTHISVCVCVCVNPHLDHVVYMCLHDQSNPITGRCLFKDTAGRKKKTDDGHWCAVAIYGACM